MLEFWERKESFDTVTRIVSKLLKLTSNSKSSQISFNDLTDSGELTNAGVKSTNLSFLIKVCSKLICAMLWYVIGFVAKYSFESTSW